MASVRNCDRTHSCPRTRSNWRAAFGFGTHKIYLVDVRAMKISKTTIGKAYLDLSYVSVGTPTVKLVKQNFAGQVGYQSCCQSPF